MKYTIVAFINNAINHPKDFMMGFMGVVLSVSGEIRPITEILQGWIAVCAAFVGLLLLLLQVDKAWRQRKIERTKNKSQNDKTP